LIPIFPKRLKYFINKKILSD
jgi:serine/threonine protein kinase